MSQLAAYTRMTAKNAPKVLAAAIPIKRLFRRPIYRLEEFLRGQLEHVVVDQVDGDTIIAVGVAIELSALCAIFKSSERDLDAIAASLSRRGGAYWFFTERHRSALEIISAGSIGYVETGRLQGFDAGDFARDVTVGTAVSFIPGPKIQGITAGRGSAIAVSKQITTKFANEQIQNVTAQTATKMFAGQATMNILPSTMSAAVLYGGSQRGSSMLDGGGNGTLLQYTTTPRPGK